MSDLELRAVYELAAPSTPPEVREEVERRIAGWRTVATQYPRHRPSTALLAAAAIRPETMLDNEFPNENNVLLRVTSVAERTNTNQPQEQASAKSETLHGLSADTRPELPEAAFVIHAYSLAQARALVAAKVAGETIVVGPVSLDGASQ